MEKQDWKKKIKSSLNYLYMGIIGAGLYYVILQVLLKIQGKELASYQGINGMNAGAAANGGGQGLFPGGIAAAVVNMYKDFVGFTVNGNVLFNSGLSAAALLLMAAVTIWVLGALCFQRKWWKNPAFFVIIGLLVLILPLATNVILLISPNVTYHLLMRYQWVCYLIAMVAFVSRYGEKLSRNALMQWGMTIAAGVMVFHYGVTDNIGYSNLEKRYEKTCYHCWNTRH